MKLDRDVVSSVIAATMNPTLPSANSQSWTRIISRIPYAITSARHAISIRPIAMLQPLEVTVVPQLWSVCELAATPTMVSIGPMQILAVKTPQYPIAIIDEAPIRVLDPTASAGS